MRQRWWWWGVQDQTYAGYGGEKLWNGGDFGGKKVEKVGEGDRKMPFSPTFFPGTEGEPDRARKGEGRGKVVKRN